MKIRNVSVDHQYAKQRGWVGKNGASSAPGSIDDMFTAETDTTTRLAPDGSGGVDWVAESTASLEVQEDGVTVVAAASAVNAGHGLDATDQGSGVAGLAVDETELNGALIPGLTTNAELNIEGGQDVIKAHGSMGATETFDPTDGNVHTGTLDANCTFTLNVPTGTGACSLEFWLTEDGTGGRTVTWPGSVTEQGTHDTTANTTQRVILETIDGGTSWIATWVGGGIASSSFATPAIVLGTAAAAGSATTTIRSDSTIVAFDATTPAAIGTAATGSVAKSARRDHVHATGAGTPTTSAIGDAAATGSGPAAAMTDHVHGREALSTATPLVESGSGAVGTAVVSSREDHVHPAASGGGASFVPIGQETRTSDGSTVTWLLDNDFEENSVQAFNLTSGKALVVTETVPNIVVIGAAGTAGDTLSFAYAASVL